MQQSEDSFESFQEEQEKRQLQRIAYEQSQMQFPDPPPQFSNLYEIYLNNQKGIAALSERIRKLKKSKRVRQILEGETEEETIEEYIDTEEQSPIYKQSIEKYQQREEYLNELIQRYKAISIVNVQVHMLQDGDIKQALHEFIANRRHIIDYKLMKDQLYVLTLENHSNSKHKKKRQECLHKERECTQRQKQSLASSKLNRGNSQTKSEHSDQSEDLKVFGKNANYYIRVIPCSSICSTVFQEAKVILLPNQHRELKLLAVNQGVIAYCSGHKIYLLSKDNQTIQLDEGVKIIYCEFIENQLYVGTNDAIMRCYHKINKQFQVVRMYVCANNSNRQITHYSISYKDNHQLIIHYIYGGDKMYEFNPNIYKHKLIAELPEEVLAINPRFIITENMLYINYWQKGKIRLEHHASLKAILNQRNGALIDIAIRQKVPTAIIKEPYGYISMAVF